MIDISINQNALKFLPKPKAIIFDWDNTLVDTWPLIHQAINITLEKMGKKKFSLEQVQNEIHKSMRDYFPQIFGNQWKQAGEIYRLAYNSINIDQIKLLPNSLDLIKTNHDLGITQFLLSNKSGITLRKELKKLQIEKYFFSAIGAFDAKFDKPHPSSVDLALSLSDIDPNKDLIWFIGDTIADIECAINSNCLPIIYGHSSHKISQSITPQILQNGFISPASTSPTTSKSQATSKSSNTSKSPTLYQNPSIIPIYFDHQQLIAILKSYS